MVMTQYREQGVLAYRGYRTEQFMNQLLSNALDPNKGRQMPIHYGDKALNFMTVSSPLGTQIPQAAGYAYGQKMAGEPALTICYFGEGIVECELLAWLVAEGDTIVEDQPVAEVMTDKATVQIPAMYSGVITKLHYQTGDIAKVHQPLFAMDISMQSSGKQHKSLASPAVRRLAKESGIDINVIKGSGNKGRVMKGDVTSNTLDFVTRNSLEPLKTAGQLSTETSAESTKMRGLQAAMAKHMAHAWASIPHFTVSDECTMDNLLAIKQTLSAQFAQADIKLTLLPFMVKAL